MKDGKVYTPDWVVNKMIDDIDFNDKSVLEPSCGMGAFFGNSKINQSKLIDAYDTDSIAIKSINKNYNFVNTYNSDFLLSDNEKKYDIIIGNPPYIGVHDLDNIQRKILLKYNTCVKGTVDIFYAFIEKCIYKLKDNGLMRLIVPNSWMMSKSASTLRKMMAYYDVSIFDFKHEKVFSTVGTYTCIIYLKKSIGSGDIQINTRDGEYFINRRNAMKGDIWVSKIGNTKDYTNIHLSNGIATLADKVFIFRQKKDNKYFSDYLNDWVDIEETAIRPIIKASTLDDYWCIYPYDNSGKLIDNFNMDNPLTYQYLAKCKDALLNRAYDGKWWEYGRTQGVKHMYGKKIVVSPIVQPKGFMYRVVDNPNTIVYSGLYQLDNFEDVINMMSDEKVKDWVLQNGRKMGGNSSFFSQTIINTLKPVLS